MSALPENEQKKPLENPGWIHPLKRDVKSSNLPSEKNPSGNKASGSRGEASFLKWCAS